MRKRLKILESKHSRGKSNEGESNEGDRGGGGGGGGGEENHNESSKNADHSENATVLEVVNRFLSSVLSLRERHDRCPDPPEVPDSAVERLISTVKRDITRYESDRGGKWNFSLLDSIEKLSSLSFSLSNLSNRTNHSKAAQSASTAVQQAMSFLGEELQILLEDPSMTNSERSSARGECKPGEHAQSDAGESHPYPPGIIEKLQRIVETMISAGYESECCQTFGAARRSAFHAMLSDVGFGKVGVNDVPKTAWESLEGEVATWTKAFRESVSVLLPRERGLCESVFSGHRAIAGSLFGSLARGVVVQLLNFAEAVATSNRSAEKLFKVLDMYETLRDMLPEMAGLLPGGEEEAGSLRSEISAARARLGEAAVLIFCELENTIKADTGRSPVQGGAVHPLACHVMGYLEHACEYAPSLQQVFDENLKGEEEEEGDEASSSSTSTSTNTNTNTSPFAAEVAVVMELLDSNIAAKAKLYKEPALSYIFLMNNGRYVAKRIKESGQIFGLLGNNWNRKRLTVLQEYHKNYRETWSKVLGCFREEGLQHPKGTGVSTPALKERLKSFNAMIEEIRKTQSQWVVSDEQMQSELRVSISAVVVPAYRSFLGRYGQYVSSAKQAKYIKFTPEDLETYIDELFVGNHSNHHHHGKKIKT